MKRQSRLPLTVEVWRNLKRGGVTNAGVKLKWNFSAAGKCDTEKPGELSENTHRDSNRCDSSRTPASLRLIYIIPPRL